MTSVYLERAASADVRCLVQQLAELQGWPARCLRLPSQVAAVTAGVAGGTAA
jgi:hypothetical protein